jgi:hypothetical protein
VFGILMGDGVGNEPAKDLSGVVAAEPDCGPVSLLAFCVPLRSIQCKCCL